MHHNGLPFLLALLLMASVFGVSAAATEHANEPQRPNVILLLVDDMGYGDIAAHGNPMLKTPNFDRLHDQSARFTNFAVSPTCGPTRAALMTGKHEFLSGNVHTLRAFRDMSLKSVTVADLFKASGYRTSLIGKWHLGLDGPFHPGKRGFQETLHCVDDNYKTTHSNPTLLKNGVETKYKGYRTDIFFDEALDFIERQKDEPFFLYLATHSPHSPHKIAGKYSKPYEAFKERYEGKKFGTGYFGMVANVDENLGRLMVHLTKLGLDDNTVVIAINDNGGTGGVDVFNDGRRGVKGTIWSGGTRAYSFWKWGNRFSPGARPQMSGHVDVLPTLADLCGLKINGDLRRQLEGESLRPLLDDANAKLNENRMQVHHVGRWEDPKTWRAHKYSKASVRWKDYTLVRTDRCGNDKCVRCQNIDAIPSGQKRPSYTTNPEHHAAVRQGHWALYDIAADPFQTNDLAVAQPDTVASMSAHYETWWKKVEVVLAERYGEPNDRSLAPSPQTGEDDWKIPADKENFHIFLLMGQSNMAGGIPGKELTEEDKTPVPGIVIRRGKGWIPAAHPIHLGGKKNGFGLGLPFAMEYKKHHPNVTVGLIPCASGGKRIDLLKKGSNLYGAAMKKSKLGMEQGVIKGILWHQGEADTVNDERADSYEGKLHQLIFDLRSDLGSENLPFIVGNLGELYGVGENPNPDPEKVARVKKLKTILRSLPDKVKFTGFVDSNGLDYCDRPKCTHFDKEGYITLGRRYTEAYHQLVTSEN